MAKRATTKTPSARSASAKAAARSSDASSGDTKYVQTRINEAGWTALKMLGFELRKTQQALFIEALNDLLRKHKKSAVVEGASEE